MEPMKVLTLCVFFWVLSSAIGFSPGVPFPVRVGIIAMTSFAGKQGRRDGLWCFWERMVGGTATRTMPTG